MHAGTTSKSMAMCLSMGPDITVSMDGRAGLRCHGGYRGL